MIDALNGDVASYRSGHQTKLPGAAAIDVLRQEALSLTAIPEPALVAAWADRAQACLNSGLDADDLRRWRETLGPLFLKSPFLRRCQEKPRGYAGDYATIQMMYDHIPTGGCAFGAALDAWAYDQPCPRAVRNRRHLVRGLIQDLQASFPNEEVSLASLGCGPAAEVFETTDIRHLRFILIDLDEEAIAYVETKAKSNGLGDRVRAQRANIIRMVLRNEVDLPAQHGFYSLGVIDYFDDELLLKFLDYAHGKLIPGGIVFLGNFRPGHPNEALFNHALDWPLVLRSEHRLLSLAKQSRFSEGDIQVGVEEENIQLFLRCVKA